MRTQPSYLLLKCPLWGLAGLVALAILLTPSCHPDDLPTIDFPPTATIILNFSGTSDDYHYLYELESYPATYKDWLGYNCPESPIFFAAYNDIDQTNHVNETIWLAHCIEGIYHQSITVTTNGTNTHPATIIGEITGGQEETIELAIPAENLADIHNGASYIILNFSYQND
jgi:hypothetical protein